MDLSAPLEPAVHAPAESTSSNGTTGPAPITPPPITPTAIAPAAIAPSPATTAAASLDLSTPLHPVTPPANTPPANTPTANTPPANTPPTDDPTAAASPGSTKPGPRGLAPAHPTSNVPPIRRAGNHERTVLSPKAPVIALNRLQSAIGIVTVEALTSAAVGDLRLGCAYELRSGQSSTVQQFGGRSTAPPNSRTPFISGSSERFQRVSIDLRHSPDLARFVIYGFSESNQTLQWGGTLVTTTFGGARIELPLDRPPSAGVTVFLSGFNVAGEFVIRAEMEIIAGTIRDACRAYGFDRITWLDGATPVD